MEFVLQKSIHSSRQRRLSRLLREVRQDAGLTQAEVAARLGRPQSFVSKYESGERRLDLIELQTVCKALDTDLVAFVKQFTSTGR